MYVVFHLGAHCTDEDRLIRGLMKNKGKLAAAGISVPNAGRYRTLLRETLGSLKGKASSPEVQAALFDAIVEEDECRRLILSNEHFLSQPEKAISEGLLYPAAATRIAALSNLFPLVPKAFCLAIRNPATLIAALLARLPGLTYADLTSGTDVQTLRWSDLIRRIQHAAPGSPITVWANEDSPLIWPEIIATVTTLDPTVPLHGTLDLVAEIMSEEGMKWMLTYLTNHKPKNPQQRRRIVSAFLTKFSLTDKIEMDLDLPGWDTALVQSLSDGYESDIETIRSMPGISFLSL